MYLFQPYHFRNQQMRLSIYIPLCIYFNTAIIGILGALAFNLHSTMYLFQRQTEYSFKALDTYLHSTMYLFQQAFPAL